jgi:hypothetical protein
VSSSAAADARIPVDAHAPVPIDGWWRRLFGYWTAVFRKGKGGMEADKVITGLRFHRGKVAFKANGEIKSCHGAGCANVRP